MSPSQQAGADASGATSELGFETAVAWGGATSAFQQTSVAPPSATSRLSSLTSQSVQAPGSGLVFQNSYSLDGTFASLTSSEQAAYETDIQQAELDLSGEFTNTFTVNVDVEAVNVTQAGGTFNALNEASAE